MKFYIILTTIILSIIVSIESCTNQSRPSPNNTTDTGTPNQTNLTGAEIYKANCVVCHGADGTMGMNGAKNLKESSLSRAQVQSQVTNGKGMMVGFGDKLNSTEIDKVVDYVLTLRK